ncbi:MAG: hypothetical protein HOP33_15565 [Verrucomicrobia bacterium]|nr:hypothetical protein [Verrucomicrobiota bacterium]
MKALIPKLITVLLALFSLNAFAATTRYVDLNSPSPTPPYTNWSTAATNIQDAIDVAVTGDLVLVTNGIYKTGGRAVFGTMTNRVSVDKPVTVQSVNGPQFTLIHGRQVPGTTIGNGSIRCAYLTNGASISGFTLTNGATRSVFEGSSSPRESSGGGIWCEPLEVLISNCVVVANSANQRGGGVYRGILYGCVLSKNSVKDAFTAFGGGAHSSTLINCMIVGNSSALDAGGAMSSTLTNCVLTGNSAAEDAGGALQSTLNNCILSNNFAGFSGGGTMYGNLYNCIFARNSAGYDGGGAAYSGSVTSESINNCVFISNSSTNYGGGAYSCTLNNCTLTGNAAGSQGGGMMDCSANNSIVYFNYAPIGSNYFYNFEGYPINYGCTAPQPDVGVGSVMNTPIFVNFAADNLHLTSNSPCINSGFNGNVSSDIDLDGNPRIAGGTVDIGAYEFTSPSSLLSYAWAQKYGVPTDGTADFTDPDGDGASNWHESHADTTPTNDLSVLRMLNATNSLSGKTVTWQSVSTRNYWLERATNLGIASPFQTIATNIVGVAGLKTFTDTSATNGGPYFYRVGVQ